MVFLEFRNIAAPRITNEPPEVVTTVIRVDQFCLETRSKRMMGIERVQIEKALLATLYSDVLAVVRLKFPREKLR